MATIIPLYFLTDPGQLDIHEDQIRVRRVVLQKVRAGGVVGNLELGAELFPVAGEIALENIDIVEVVLYDAN